MRRGQRARNRRGKTHGSIHTAQLSFHMVSDAETEAHLGTRQRSVAKRRLELGEHLLQLTARTSAKHFVCVGIEVGTEEERDIVLERDAAEGACAFVR